MSTSSDQSKQPEPKLNKEELDELFKSLFVDPVVICDKSFEEVSGKFRIPRRYKDHWLDSEDPDEGDTYIVVEDEEFYGVLPPGIDVTSTKSLKAVLPESAETKEADKDSKRKIIEPEHVHETPKRQNVLVPPFVPEEEV